VDRAAAVAVGNGSVLTPSTDCGRKEVGGKVYDETTAVDTQMVVQSVWVPHCLSLVPAGTTSLFLPLLGAWMAEAVLALARW